CCGLSGAQAYECIRTLAINGRWQEMPRACAQMNNHDDRHDDRANETTIENLIAAAIQKGAFVPTASCRQAHASEKAIDLDPTKTDLLQENQLLAVPPPPEMLNKVSFLSPSSVDIPSQTPLENYQYFVDQGYCCVKVMAAGRTLKIPALKEAYSWDQQLILSIWHCLQRVEHSSASSAERGSSVSAMQSPLLDWFETTAQLSSQKRLEKFSRDFIFWGLKAVPIAIFIDSLAPFEGVPHALETLFTWIWKCYRQLEQQTNCHPLRFVVLGKVVT
ncbi:MAG: hypothetical protein ABG776_04180, partial [Cyanobacteria bacterium J06555_13]